MITQCLNVTVVNHPVHEFIIAYTYIYILQALCPIIIYDSCVVSFRIQLGLAA